MAAHDAEGVLARWSRRKQASRHGRAEEEPAAAEPPAVVPEEAAPPPPEAAAAEPPPELPDPDTLDDPGAFKAFMAKGVPPELRRRALRRLWRLDPIYSHHDGLDDFCGDYTDAARVVPDLKTAYRVGRGFLDQVASPKEPPAAGDGRAEDPDRDVADAPAEPAASSGDDAQPDPAPERG
jgi:hypothetical protein